MVTHFVLEGHLENITPHQLLHWVAAPDIATQPPFELFIIFRLFAYLRIFLQFARVIRKIQETVTIGFAEEYPFWFAVDFVRRFVFAAVIVYEKDSEVCMCLCMYTHMHTHTSIVYPFRTCVCIRKYTHCIACTDIPCPSPPYPFHRLLPSLS